MKEELGLDKPIVVQYVDWMKKFVTGDWGFTFQTNQSIKTEVVRALPISAYIMVYAQLAVIAVRGTGGDVVGVSTGFEVRPDRHHDRVRVVVGAQLHRRARAHGVVQCSTKMGPVPVDLCGPR